MRSLQVALYVLVSTALSAADNPFLGTWKLNTEKSKSTGIPLTREMTVKFEADGNKVRRIAAGTDAEGKPIMQGGPEGASIEWDGKDRTIPTQQGPPMTVAVKRVNDYENRVTVKQRGKVIGRIRSVVSKDGKTMTNTADGVTEKGEKFHQVEVLDKQ